MPALTYPSRDKAIIQLGIAMTLESAFQESPLNQSGESCLATAGELW